MFVVVSHVFGIVGVHEGVIEKAEPELGGKHMGNCAVHFAFRHNALLHLRQQRAINRAIRQVVVHAGANAQPRGICIVIGHMMGVDQHLQPIAIRSNVALEAPLLAQNAVEEPVIDVRRHAIDLVIRGHHAAHPGFLNGGLEWH